MLPSRRNRSSPAPPDEGEVQQLHRDLTGKATVAALGQPHAAHATLPYRRDERVGAERLARQRLSRRSEWHVLEKVLPTELLVRFEQSADLGSRRRFVGGERVEPCSPLGAFQIERAVEVLAQREPAIVARRGHRRTPSLVDRKRWNEHDSTEREGFNAGRLRQTRFADDAVQVDSSLLPIALYGTLGYAAHRCNLAEREAAKELQIDDLRESGVHARQVVERVAQARQHLGIGDLFRDVGVERRDLELTAAFLGAAVARVVDDEAAHHPRRVGHEPRAVGKPAPSRPEMSR